MPAVEPRDAVIIRGGPARAMAASTCTGAIAVTTLHGVAAGSRFRLTISAVTGSRYAPFLRKHLRAAHRLVRPRLGELSVALVGDRRMSELHEQFMGVAGPTDVLTFPLDLDARGSASCRSRWSATGGCRSFTSSSWASLARPTC